MENESSPDPLSLHAPPSLTRTSGVLILLLVAAGAGILCIHAAPLVFCETVVAILPATIVLQHGIYLHMSSPKWLVGATNETQPLASATQNEGATQNEAATQIEAATQNEGATQNDSHDDRQAATRVETQQMFDKHFGTIALVLDYGVPTILNLCVGQCLVFLAINPWPELNLGQACRDGMRYGAAGAYVYSLMMLGSRTFQRDVTSGAALWSAIQMVLGPLLGGVIAGVAVLTDSGRANNSTFAANVVYFFAGMAPRQIVIVIKEVGRHIFEGGQSISNDNLIPLSRIRGITPLIAERLLEEGISDGFQLAMANPVRLMRSTPFDERQILAWIDEALLHAALPLHAKEIEREGITGAIDLAYYYRFEKERFIKRLYALARRVRVDGEGLCDVVRRLNGDKQVDIVWSLYNDMNPYDERPKPGATQRQEDVKVPKPARKSRRTRANARKRH